MTPTPRPELHRPLAVEAIGPHGLEVEVRADAAEREALAARMAVPGLLELACRFRLTPAPGGVVLAEGDLTARAMRVCVVTLEPLRGVDRGAFPPALRARRHRGRG